MIKRKRERESGIETATVRKKEKLRVCAVERRRVGILWRKNGRIETMKYNRKEL